MKKLWQFFCSLRLTLYLGFILCALLWLGSVYLSRYGQVLSALDIETLFPWLYRQGWRGLSLNWWLWLAIIDIFLLAVNTLVCSIDFLNKILPRLFQPKLDITPQWLNTLSVKRELTINAPIEDVRKSIQRGLFFKGFKKYNYQGNEKDTHVIYTQRGAWTAIAPYIVHLGFILVLLGHFISSGWGFKSFGNRLELGDKISLPNSSLWVRFNGLDLCSDPKKCKKILQDRSLCSILTLGEGQEKLFNQHLGINKPLLYQGFAVYQASYGRETKGVNINITQNKEKKSVLLKLREQKSITSDIQLLAYALIPDFAFSPEGAPISLSNEYNNPALLLMVLEQGVPVKQAWLFLNKINHQTTTYKDLEIKFSGMVTTSIVYLNIVRNPGALIVLIGGILFILAAAWGLLGNRRRLWFYLERQEEEIKIYCGGIATQKRYRLQENLDFICNGLENKFKLP